jgi:PST family polysaccharide transporter
MGALGEPAVSPPSPGEGAGGTGRRVFHSTVASYGIQIARLLIGFVTRLALARLILPEGHGIFELALRIVTVAAAVRDLGLPFHLIRDERRPYGAVLAFTAASGSLLTLALIAAAPLFGGKYPDLPDVLRVFAVWIVLDGLAVVPKAYCERELVIGKLVGPEIVRLLLFGAVAVVLSLYGMSFWALVAAELASAALYAAWAWAGAWRGIHLIHLGRDLRLLPDLLAKSSYLFWIWLLVHLVTYVDVFIIGWFRNATAMGLYTNAYRIISYVVPIAYPRALFPTLVAYRDDRPRFLEAFRLGNVQLLSLQVLAAYFLFFNGEKSVAIILGKGWEGSVVLVQLLALMPLFDPFSISAGELLKAQHRDRLWLAMTALDLASLVGFGVFLTHRYGAAGMAVANWLRLGGVWMTIEVFRLFRPRARTILADLAFLYLTPLPFFALVVWLLPAASWERFAVSAVAAAGAGGVFLWRYWRPFRSFYSGG